MTTEFATFASAAAWMDQHPALLSLIIVAGFLVVFPLFWCFVVRLISLAGWRRLAPHYAIAKPPPGEVQKVMCGMVGVATYRGVLRCQPQPDGLYLWTSRFFGSGHPPLFIPWSDITAGPSENRRFYQFVVLKVGDPLIATIRLMGVSLAGTPLAGGHSPPATRHG